MSERVVIDKGGRIVIPKSLRDSLGYVEGDLLIVEQRDGDLVLRAEETDGGLVHRDGHLFKPSVRGARKLTTGDVRRQLAALRSRGAPRVKGARKKPAT